MNKLLIVFIGLSLIVASCSKKVANATTAPTAPPKSTTTSPTAASTTVAKGSDAKAIEVLKNYIDAIIDHKKKLLFGILNIT